MRACISSWARLLKATRLTADGGTRHTLIRCRARSVSTRVLPEPAGAMIRADPPACDDRRQLIGGELGGGVVRAWQGELAVLDLHRVQHRDAGDRIEVPDRAAVEPHRLAGRQHDVAGFRVADRLGAERDGGVERRPPRRVVDAQVDGVAPDEVVELVEPERVAGAEQMLRALVDLAWRIVERRSQLDDQRLGVGRGAAQVADDRVG